MLLTGSGMLGLAALYTVLAQPEPAPRPHARPVVPAGVRALYDLEYARPEGRSLKLDLYLPEKAQGPLPVVMWVHGGAWMSGHKEDCPALFLTARGYAVATITYRLTQVARFPAQIQDCKAAVRWLRAHAKEHNLSPERIGAWGSSAGGHLVALLGTSGGVKALEGEEGSPGHSSRVQAVCDWFGPTDFLQMSRYPCSIQHDAPDSPESRLIGGPIQQRREAVERANPITYISKDDPPFLIMHGDRDMTVPLNQSELLYEALRRAGVPAAMHVVKGAGHGFGGPANNEMVVEFFDRHLKAPAK